jgi:hypothetical protein
MAEVRHNQGEAGGYLVGRRHSQGGIKAVNKSTGQPLEMEGGEVVITRDAVSDPEKRSFNGKMMTNRQILSEINQSGGGVAFADGGELPESMHFDADAEYEYGGTTMCGRDLASKMSYSQSMEEGGETKKPNEDYISTSFSYKISYEAKNGNIDWVQGSDFLVLYTKNASSLDSERNSAYVIKSMDTPVSITLSVVSDNLTQNSQDEFILTFKKGEVTITASDITDGTIAYDDIVEDFTEQLLDIDEKWAQDYAKTAKVYLVKAHGGIYTDNVFVKQRILRGAGRASETATLFRNTYEEKEDFPWKFRGTSASEWETFAPNKSEQNYKSYEQVSRLLKKEWSSLSQNDSLSIASDHAVCLATLYGVSEAFINYQVDFGPKLPKDFGKWSWWIENVFYKDDQFQAQLYVTSGPKAFRMPIRKVDFSAYECELAITQKDKRTRPTADKLSKAISNALSEQRKISNQIDVDFRVNLKFSSIFSENFKIRTNRFVADFSFSWEDSKNDNRTIDVSVSQQQFFFASDSAIFYFDQDYNSWRSKSFIIGNNPEAAKELAKRAAEAAEKKKAEAAEQRRIQREAEEAEQRRKEELANRPWQVRDQPEDAEVWPYEFSDPQIIQVEKDLVAARKLVKLAEGLRNADSRRALLRKAQGLQKKLNQLKLDENAQSQGVDSKKLNTPIGLFSYYFNQARQSPVKRMGDACGLDTPTGVPSKLDIQAYYAVRTTYFKKWFGDWEEAAMSGDYSNCSILVDEDTKEPRIMYHGVRKFDARVQTGAMGQGISRPFGEFNPPKFPATYFGDSLAYVEFYAGQAENQPKVDENYEGFIYSVFINMRNPIRLDGLGLYSSYKDLLAYIAIKYGIIVNPSADVLRQLPENKRLKVWNYVRNDFNLILTLKKAGYDGIIQYGDVPKFNVEGQPSGMFEEKEYLVFDANQVKSAVVKKSFYLPQFNDVRFKDGGHVRL